MNFDSEFELGSDKYCCPYYKSPEFCSCSTCYLHNKTLASKNLLKKALDRNQGRSGTSFSIVKGSEVSVPKESVKEKIQRQARERIQQREVDWKELQETAELYSKHRAEVEGRSIPDFNIEEALAAPALDGIAPVKLDPASMLADDIESVVREGKEFIETPTLAGLASMAVFAIPGKYADGLIDFVGKYKGKDIILNDMKMIDVKYLKRDREELKQLRRKFNNGIKQNYLKELSSDQSVISKLKELNVPDVEINKLSIGRVPASFEVHHKLPLDDSGTNDFSNLVLIRKAPEHAALTTYQKQTTKGLNINSEIDVQWPIPFGSVYPRK